MVVSENGLELARSKGAFVTWLVRVSPQVVPRPGRSLSTSSGRRELRDSLREASALFFGAGEALSAAGPAPVLAPAGGAAEAGASAGGELRSALEPSSAEPWGAVGSPGNALGSLGGLAG